MYEKRRAIEPNCRNWGLGDEPLTEVRFLGGEKIRSMTTEALCTTN